MGTQHLSHGSARHLLLSLWCALSLLDIPTEWYLDTTGKILYLWTTNSASPATHVVEIKTRTKAARTLDNRSYVTVNGICRSRGGHFSWTTPPVVVNNCNLILCAVQHHQTTHHCSHRQTSSAVLAACGRKLDNPRYSVQDGIRCTGQNEVVSNCVIEQVDYYPGTYYAGVTAFSGGAGTKIVNNTLWYSGRYWHVGSSTPGVEMGYNDMGWGSF